MIFIKSYNHLWKKILSDNNILLAIKHAAKGKNKNNSRHRLLRHISNHAEDYIDAVRTWIICYKSEPHREIIINDGISAKKRRIMVPTAKELIVHHALINVLKPIFLPSMYEHSYGSLPGKGLHKGVKTVKKWVQKNYIQTRYCAKLDIYHFFESIDTKILYDIISKRIRDKRLLELIREILNVQEKGVPLGFITSQWFAHIVLNRFDHYLKESLGIKRYIRFVDDMVIFSISKRHLRGVVRRIEWYLWKFLRLKLKGNWQIFPILDHVHTSMNGRPLDFLGYKFYRDRVCLRGKIALKAQRKAKHIFKKGRANVKDARQIIVYASITRYANVYRWFKTHIDKYVDIKKMRKIVSTYDRSHQRRNNYAQIA